MARATTNCDLRGGYLAIGGEGSPTPVYFPSKKELASGSRTLIFYGHSIELGRDVVGKLSVDAVYDYEARVYEEMVPKLLRLAPHFLPHAFVVDCPQSALTVTAKLRAEVTRNVQLPRGRVRILATPFYANARALDLIARAMGPIEYFNVFFQVCVALLALQTVRGMHNDLFERNVLVIEYDTVHSMQYTLDGELRTLRTRFEVLFFDWDRAYFEALGPNPVLLAKHGTHCIDGNECNRFEQGKELLTFACGVRDRYPREFDEVFASLPAFQTAVRDLWRVRGHAKDTGVACRYRKDDAIRRREYAAADIGEVLRTFAISPNLKRGDPRMWDQPYSNLDAMLPSRKRKAPSAASPPPSPRPSPPPSRPSAPPKALSAAARPPRPLARPPPPLGPSTLPSFMPSRMAKVVPPSVLRRLSILTQEQALIDDEDEAFVKFIDLEDVWREIKSLAGSKTERTTWNAALERMLREEKARARGSRP